MRLRDEQAFITVACECGVNGPLPLSAIRQAFLCRECGKAQTLGEEKARKIEAAIAEALTQAAGRVADGEERVRVEVRLDDVKSVRLH